MQPVSHRRRNLATAFCRRLIATAAAREKFRESLNFCFESSVSRAKHCPEQRRITFCLAFASPDPSFRRSLPRTRYGGRNPHAAVRGKPLREISRTVGSGLFIPGVALIEA